MNALQDKANGAKIVTPATAPKANATPQNGKSEAKTLILETTAEKRIKNLQIFEKICEKHNFLKEKSDELNAYLVGRDGLKETVTIENTNGLCLEISNSSVITEILNLSQSKIFALLEESEKEVLKFVI